jgi:hypothetical protein
MNKSKNFFFAVVIVVLMLFILGNWAISARAIGAGDIDATPTPTIVPMDTPSGEIPSAEEQEALKAVVQAYIEIRYRALSVSNAEDFKQNGFGNLVSSDLREAGVFLSEEKAKLAVEIKHAELDHLRYVNHKVLLNFRSITVDPKSRTTTISVIEGNEAI